MLKKLKIAAFLIAGVVSFQSNAALLSTNWKTSGDALATLDTETGIEWLDLSETFNLSFDEMNARLSSDLQGWRYATFDEAVSLVSRFYGSPVEGWKTQFLPAAYDTLAKRNEWRSLFGSTGADDGVSMGAVRKNPLDNTRWSIIGPYRYGYDYTFIPSMTDVKYDYSAKNGYSGYFIVNDGGVTLSSIQNPTLNANNPNAPVNNQPAPVSAPVGLSLFAALLSLAMFRRRQTDGAVLKSI